MKLKYFLHFIFASFLLISCQPEYLSLEKNSSEDDGFSILYNEYEINIISDPPGAKIEWDGDLIGTTPYKYIVTGRRGKGSGITVVKAYPIKEGQYLQTKFLYPNAFLPKTIYFNLNLRPTN